MSTPSLPTSDGPPLNPSGNHGPIPTTTNPNSAPPSSGPRSSSGTSLPSLFSSPSFTEGGAFSLSRLFGSVGGAGFPNVGNDVANANHQWRTHNTDAETEQTRLAAENRRLEEMGANDDDNPPPPHTAPAAAAPPTADTVPAHPPSHPSALDHTAAPLVPHPAFAGAPGTSQAQPPSQPQSHPTRHDGQQQQPRLHLPQLPKDAQSKAELRLSHISDPKIRAFLDPSDDSIRPHDLWDWSEAELQSMVDAIEPVHLTGLIRKNVEYFSTERCKPLAFDSLSLRNASGRYALRGVSGFLNPGQTVAILSAPDAGTTNLLNVLAERQETGEIGGTVLYDGRPRDESFKRHVGYVVKDDINFAMLTVEETLMFSAQCRTPYAPRKVIEFRVKLVMKLLGLSHAANTYIGDASIKGVSGGEKRRVSYGVEMVAGHGCILADLPTNGLDSASAYALIKTIRYINRSGGRSMMCSIVQPAPALYALFDSVMLLSKGSVIYFGPVKTAGDWVRAAGFVKPKEKSEPQWLEELTATPERFYVARLEKEGRIGGGGEGRQGEKGMGGGGMGGGEREEEVKEEVKEGDGQGPPAPPPPRSDGKLDSDEVLRVEMEKEPTDEVKHDEAELKQAVERMPRPEKEKAGERVTGVGKEEMKGADEVEKSATEAEPDEEVKEYTIGDEKVLASPQRMSAWKLLADHYASSLYAQRVTGVIAKEKERAASEDQLLTHNSPQQRGGGSYHSPSEPTHTDTSMAGSGRDAAAAKLDRFTGSMGVIEMARGRTEMEMEERGPGGGRYRFNRTFLQQVIECIHRQFLLTYRTPGLWFGSWVKASLMAIIAGTLFLNMPTTAQYGRTRLGLFFFICIYIGVGAVEILAFLMLSRSIYYSQRKAGYFRGLAYYIAVMVSQIPLAVVETFLFAITVYGLAGLRDNDGSSQFWFFAYAHTLQAFFWFVILIVNLTSRCWVFSVSTLSPNAVVAFVIIPISNVLFVQFAGFLEQRDAIPIGWRWMNYASFYDWAWRALSVNELYNLDLTYDPSNPTAPYTNGNQVLEAYSITDDGHHKWYDLLWLILFMIGFACLGACLILTVDWSRADTPQTPDFGEEAVAKKRKAAAHKEEMQKQIGQKTSATSPNASAGAAATGGTPPTLPPTNQPGPTQLSRARSSQRSRKVLNASYVSHQRDAYFQWQHLNYTVRLSNGTDRMLLTDCFGYARPGVMVALMGASGAGKSTLLDVLAGKKTAGHMEGEVLLNGKPFEAKSFNHTAAYGEQFDSHNAFSTVKEAITFSALLRLPSSITSQDGEVERRVVHVMDVLDLQHSANDIIGAPGFGGVSPEVTIAVELVMDPALLFLDEPTTGLDSAGAYAVMSSVKKLAQQMAVVCTIHQPSNEIVHMFDWLLLLQPGGQVVFFGPVHDLVSFFVDNKIAQAPADPDSPDLNVADFALDAIRTANANKGKEGAVDMVKAFKDSDRYKEIQAELDKKTAHTREEEEEEEGSGGHAARQVAANTNANVGPGGRAESERSAAAANPDVAAAEDDHNYAGFPTQLYLLTQRNFKNTYRNRLTFKTRYLTAVILGFVCGTLFWHLDWSQEAAQTRVSVMFVSTIIPMFLSSSALAEVFAVRPLYFREVTSRMYNPLAWFLARRLADVPYYFVETVIFGTMVYWIAWMRHDNNGGYFFWYLFTLLGVRATGSAFTQAVATAFATPEVASAFQSTAFTIFFLFAGFLIPRPLIANGWIWMFYLSFIRYPLDFLLANELADVAFDCSDYAANPSDCPIPSGNTLLDEFGVDYSTGQRAIDIVSLWIFFAGFLVLGFLALRFINHIKR